MASPPDWTHAAGFLEDEYQVSERKTSQVLALHRKTKRRLQRCNRIDDVVEKMIELYEARPRWGYRKVHDRLKIAAYGYEYTEQAMPAWHSQYLPGGFQRLRGYFCGGRRAAEYNLETQPR